MDTQEILDKLLILTEKLNESWYDILDIDGSDLIALEEAIKFISRELVRERELSDLLFRWLGEHDHVLLREDTLTALKKHIG